MYYVDLDDHIEWSLDACQATTSLDLADCALLPVQLKPAIKALTHHYALQHLNFSGNQLGDEGVQVNFCIIFIRYLIIKITVKVNVTISGKICA